MQAGSGSLALPSFSNETALRLGFRWRRAAWGFLRKACEDRDLALKHPKHASRCGFESVIDHHSKHNAYAVRMGPTGASKAANGTRCR